jgi:FdhE protein
LSLFHHACESIRPMAEKQFEKIDRLIQRRPMYKEALLVYRELLGFLHEIEPEITYTAGDASVREIKAREGFPLFSRGDLPIDHECVVLLFQRLLKHLSSTQRKDREALEKTLKRAQGEPNWVRDVIAAFLSGDEARITAMAQEVTLSPMVVKFLAHMALQPSMRFLRESARGGILDSIWDYGYCPLCGSPPDMAYFSDEGTRFLHCELCGHEWHYLRLKCPFCGEERAKELGYFTSEGEDGYRVDFCKKCKRYIKTLDMRLIGPPAPLELENLITLHLDMLAHEQGFKPPHG